MYTYKGLTKNLLDSIPPDLLGLQYNRQHDMFIYPAWCLCCTLQHVQQRMFSSLHAVVVCNAEEQHMACRGALPVLDSLAS